MSNRHSGKTPLWMCILLLFILGYTSMFNNISLPNERSRAYMAVALVDHHTAAIDKPLKRFGRIGDRARFQGRHYSDKAPGSAFLGSISYGLARLFTEAQDWSIAQLLKLFRRTVSLPLALLGFVSIRRILALYNQNHSVVEWTSWGWLLGSTAFHYSGAYFGHQMAASILVGSFLYMRLAILNDSNKSLVFSGLLSGAAVVIEYPAALGVLSIGVYGLLSITLLRSRIMIWILAGVPCAVLLGWYHNECFGSPWSFPYEHLAAATYRKIHGAGLAGVTAPEFEAFHLWFLSMRRGLLSGAPFFCLSALGLIGFARVDWRAGASLGLFTLAVVLFASSAHIWGGDWGYGPRILVFALGLLTVPVCFGLSMLSKHIVTWSIGLVLMLYSIATQQLVHFIFPEPWSKFSNPVADLSLTLSSDWLVAPNIATIHFGWSGQASLWPLLIALTIVVSYLFSRARAGHTHNLIPAVMLGAGLLLAGSLNYTQRQQHIETKWVELIKLWSSREAKYH